MLNNEDNNNKTKYIIPLLLSFAKIEKFKNISENSFKYLFSQRIKYNYFYI